MTLLQTNATRPLVIRRLPLALVGRRCCAATPIRHNIHNIIVSTATQTNVNDEPRPTVLEPTHTATKLYQYKICPFSNIAKVVLQYQQIPFQSIEVNPLTKAELNFSKEYRKVPIVRQNEQQWNGTEEILEKFGPEVNKGSSSQRWVDFARNRLAPLLYPNLCNTVGNSFRAFDYVHHEPTFSMVQKYSIQYLGSIAMYFAASKIKQKYQLDNVRVALKEALIELEEGLKSCDRMFLNNEIKDHSPQHEEQQQPHLGDLAVFGVLKGLEGLAILTDDILKDERFPKIQQWYSDMSKQLESKTSTQRS